MPKGARGCYVCAAVPATMVVQVTLYGFPDGHVWGATKQKTIDSAQRSYCAACAAPVIERVRGALERRHTAAHGCRMCGASPTVGRVQLWVREKESGSQRTVSSLSIGLCGDHRLPVYVAAMEPLDGSALRREGPGSPHGGNFASARGSRLRPLGSK